MFLLKTHARRAEPAIATDARLLKADQEYSDWMKAQGTAAGEVHDAAHKAATSHLNDLPHPSEAQLKAGNYKKGKIRLHGLDITIENPKGSTRSGVDPDGNAWSVVLPAHYGDIKRSTGADGDAVDISIGDYPESELVFVIDQVDEKTGEFDEQ